MTVIVVGLLAVAAGCLGLGEGDVSGEEQGDVSGGAQPLETSPDPPRKPLTVHDNGTMTLEVPLQVVTIGFDPGVAEGLAENLSTFPVKSFFSYTRDSFPPDADEPTTVPLSVETPAQPLQPVANVSIVQAPDEVERELFDLLPTLQVEGVDRPDYHANPVEDFLARELPNHGIRIDPNTPSLVLLHADEALPEDHAYNYSYPGGWMEPVRAFGERQPLLVLDVSAREDPWVTEGSYPSHAYDRQLPPGGEEPVDALDTAVRHAAGSRLLHSAGVPVPTSSCVGVTMVLAIRSGSLAEALPSQPDAEDLLPVDRIEQAWGHVLDPARLHVDVEILQLPQDAPALGALARGYIGTAQQLSWWAQENWERFWVEHEGCEPVLGFAFVGDAATAWDAGYAIWPGAKGARTSFSWISDWYRFTWDYEGPGEEQITGGGNRTEYAPLGGLLTHEVGHTLGLRHSHDGAQQGDQVVPGFSSVWSTMSYHVSQPATELGWVERATLHRARAGLLLEQAHQQDLENTTAYARALEHLRAYEWGRVAKTLWPIVGGTWNPPAEGSPLPSSTDPRTDPHPPPARSPEPPDDLGAEPPKGPSPVMFMGECRETGTGSLTQWRTCPNR